MKGATTLSITTLRVTTLSIMPLSMMGLIGTLSIKDIMRNVMQLKGNKLAAVLGRDDIFLYIAANNVTINSI